MPAARVPPDGAPPWATALIRRVCADHGRRVPPVRWRRRSGPATSGAVSYDGTGIRIVAGTDPGEARLVLLHELAHHLVGPMHQHDERFWRTTWELYERYGADLRLAWEAETAYRKRAGAYAPPRIRRRFDGPLRRAG